MTKEEFLAGYALRSGVTVEWLLEQGEIALPCRCGEPNCLGWALFNEVHLMTWARIGYQPKGVSEEDIRVALAEASAS